MFNFFRRRKSQRVINAMVINWLDDLDSIITIIDNDINELRKDLADLTDFVEGELD